MALGLTAFCRYAFIRKYEFDLMLSNTTLNKKAKKTIPDD